MAHVMHKKIQQYSQTTKQNNGLFYFIKYVVTGHSAKVSVGSTEVFIDCYKN